MLGLQGIKIVNTARALREPTAKGEFSVREKTACSFNIIQHMNVFTLPYL